MSTYKPADTTHKCRYFDLCPVILHIESYLNVCLELISNGEFNATIHFDQRNHLWNIGQSLFFDQMSTQFSPDLGIPTTTQL